MDRLKRLVSASEMTTLREGIKSRYKAYYVLNRDQFPDFEYNTNRANYEPLRTSFEEELYIVRGIDRANPTIHIPSTNTLALLFTDDRYIPNKRILNTCRLYASTATPDSIPEPNSPVLSKPLVKTQTRIPWVWILSIGLIATISFAVFALSSSGNKVVPEELVMYYPKQRQTVSRVVSVAGKVKNADKVWVVVHPVFKGDKFYVQDPILVDKNGNWSGEILVGKPLDDTTAHIFEIRAFVNPSGRYQAIEKKGTVVFDSWPDKVALATNSIVVVRKPKSAQPYNPASSTP